MEKDTQINKKEKLSKYRKKLLEIKKLCNAVNNIYARTDENYNLNIGIKLTGIELYIRRLEEDLVESDFKNFDLTYKGILMWLSECIQIYAEMQNI